MMHIKITQANATAKSVVGAGTNPASNEASGPYSVKVYLLHGQ
jgi:hypothetical protein